MIEVHLPIRTAWVTALAGLTVNGESIGVYDSVPTNATKNYVVVRDQDSFQDIGGRGCEKETATILIDIVTRFPANTGGKKTSEQIAAEIYSRVSNVALQSPLQLLSTKKIMDVSLPAENDNNQKIFRKEIRFEHSIFK